MKLWPSLVVALSLASTGQAQYTPCEDLAQELEIRNKLSLYAILIDTKDFNGLSQVLTRNAIVDYGFISPGGVLKGITDIRNFLGAILGTTVTQHSISTTVVDCTAQDKPISTSYLVATTFGQGADTGKVLQVYGKYTDYWVLDLDSWKSKNKTLTFFPPGIIGDLAFPSPPAPPAPAGNQSVPTNGTVQGR